MRLFLFADALGKLADAVGKQILRQERPRKCRAKTPCMLRPAEVYAVTLRAFIPAVFFTVRNFLPSVRFFFV